VAGLPRLDVCISGRGPSDHLPERQDQVEATMKGPYLKVARVRPVRRWRLWKVWLTGIGDLRETRLEGPAVIYQDGSIVWRQP
jgi:hypothetical protein